MLFDLLFIFFARIIDVSLSTIRMILIIRGDRYISAVIGFFEIMVYVIALGKVINHLTEPLKLVLYCLGFASGVIVGSWIEERIALGYRGIQVIIERENGFIADQLREDGYAVTTWEAQGLEGKKLVMNTWLKRTEAMEMARRVKEFDENAFVVFIEPKSFSGGYLAKK
ncbi:MAG: DUF2179 domain-containing protein [Chitinophagales bacterium]